MLSYYLFGGDVAYSGCIVACRKESNTWLVVQGFIELFCLDQFHFVSCVFCSEFLHSVDSVVVALAIKYSVRLV